MEDINNIQFERYLSDKMDSAERIAFEEVLDKDEEIASEFEEFRLIYDAMKIVGDNLLKDELEGIHTEMESETKEVKLVPKQNIRWSRIAAALIIVFGCTYFILSNKQVEKSNLYAEHFEIYEAPSWSRGDANEDANWVNFIEEYESGNYTSALDNLNIASEPPSYLISFYKGLCYQLIPSPDFERSIIEFEHVLELDNDFHNSAMWYAAFAHIELENYSDAEQIFEVLMENSNYKQTECKEILKSLQE